jgi:hypothetical protein
VVCGGAYRDAASALMAVSNAEGDRRWATQVFSDAASAQPVTPNLWIG